MQIPIFTDEDNLFPVYCLKCHKHIPRSLSNFNKGYCGICVPNFNQKLKTNNSNSGLWLVLSSCVVGFFFFVVWITSYNKTEYESKIKLQKLANDPKEIERKEQEKNRGPKPKDGWWDGACEEIHTFFKHNLNDYKSLDVIEASRIVPWGETTWAQRVKYRAKNAFGGYVLDNRVFVIENGMVINSFPFFEN